MGKQFLRANSGVLLFILMTLVLCVIYSYVSTEKPSYIGRYSRGYAGNHYISARVVAQVAKLKDHNDVLQILNDYPNSNEQGIIDEDLYKRQLSLLFKNSMLFASFISIMMSSLFIMLRRNRREYFEETCFMLRLIIKSYIHRVDGEWEENSLKHSF